MRDIYLMRRELGRKLGAKGWLYPSGEKKYGGGGLDLDQIIVLEEETARLGLGLPPYYDSGGKMGSASIRVWGTEEQKQRFLPPIYKGEVRSWQLLTEPSAGSDLAGVRTTAIRDGDVYVLNGQKIYIGSHHGADRYWTIAVTDPKGKRHQNVSWFMIDAALPGIDAQPLHMLSAQSEGETDEFGHKNIIFFDNVRVPADCLVGRREQRLESRLDPPRSRTQWPGEHSDQSGVDRIAGALSETPSRRSTADRGFRGPDKACRDLQPD